MKQGVFPDSLLRDMFDEGALSSATPLDGDQIQPASLDLRLGGFAVRVRASFLPGGTRSVEAALAEPGMELHRFELGDRGAVLETGCVYLIPLQESLCLSENVRGRANPKSSTGRIDVFTRVVVDHSRAFDEIQSGYKGNLWLEVSPRTFPILVRPGDRLAQLRLRHKNSKPVSEIIVSIDLKTNHTKPVGWRAKRHGGLIDLKAVGQHPIEAFWEPVFARDGRVVLDPEEFYILVSQESVKIATDQAAEMAPIAPELGEFRAHYAGFFDPGFGLNEGGSRAVLEVRSRDVPFILEHGQPVAKLVFEDMRMPPQHLYGGISSNYQGQGLRLSKHFVTFD